MEWSGIHPQHPPRPDIWILRAAKAVRTQYAEDLLYLISQFTATEAGSPASSKRNALEVRGVSPISRAQDWIFCNSKFLRWSCAERAPHHRPGASAGKCEAQALLRELSEWKFMHLISFFYDLTWGCAGTGASASTGSRPSNGRRPTCGATAAGRRRRTCPS